MKSAHENIITLLDCFSGVDGGISFVKLRFFLEGLESDPSDEAQRMLLSLEHLARLIDALNNH